ncbi:hypothetical protein GCM10022403_069670 [Streptomyces coacervatus]|uniref:Transposase IS204/IS1001/IS1096/IS1165 DDE domain-containing protein n=1 Tax=Streptomyces coacervatus TaxID=647381 RepID=A0ABP7ITI5_9ACTN
MSDPAFACPDLTTFARLDELGLQIAGQRLEPDRAVPACRVVEPDDWCHRCGCQGSPRDTVTRPLAHEPAGTSNGPTEAINGRLAHLPGSALGFRNLANYIARSLLETGGFRAQLHPRL